MMPESKELLDCQLSRVHWTQDDREAVYCAIGKEKPVVKRKLAVLLAVALLLMLLTGAAVAATVFWGVEDFALRDGTDLPDVPVQQGIAQRGGMGREMSITVTNAVWDGATVYIALYCQPKEQNLLLLDSCLDPDMPVRNLDRQLPHGGTIGEWAASRGFTDMLGVAVEPMLNGEYLPCQSVWHLEESGGYTLLCTFEGLSVGAPMELRFQCVTWGWDEARRSFCSEDRNESIDLFCTLTPPEAP